MTARIPKNTLELAARALCRQQGIPEDTQYQGAKMWQSQLAPAMAILRDALPADDFRRLVLDQPWPGPVPRKETQGNGTDTGTFTSKEALY